MVSETVSAKTVVETPHILLLLLLVSIPAAFARNIGVRLAGVLVTLAISGGLALLDHVVFSLMALAAAILAARRIKLFQGRPTQSTVA